MVQFYAKIQSDIVVDVHVVADSVVDDGGEQAGADLLSQLWGGEYVRFSPAGEFRYNKAHIGDIYDPVRDAFMRPQPYPSWILDEETCTWQAPIPAPSSGAYYWDEVAGDWIAIES